MADIMVQLQKLANQNTAKTFQYNTQEANAARSWQERMSNTSHQREVKDLIAAGLNPVLSANTGAQSYTTSSASGTADSAVNAIGNVQSSRNSAAATRYAADRSLQASRAMASAQMYSANMAFEAQKYAALHKSIDNMFSNTSAYKRNKYSADVSSETQKWITKNKPASNKFELFDKYLGSSNDYASRPKSLTPAVIGKAIKSDVTPWNASKVANSVSSSDYNVIKRALSNNGYMTTDYNIAIVINAIANGKNLDLRRLTRKGDHANSASFTRHFY